MSKIIITALYDEGEGEPDHGAIVDFLVEQGFFDTDIVDGLAEDHEEG